MDGRLLEQLSRITAEEQEILDAGSSVNRQLYTAAENMVIDSGKLLASGKLIAVRPHTRFIHFPQHSHNYIEMVYMCKGSTTHIINGKEVVLNSGEILLLSQSAVQEILAAEENDIAVNFIILPQFFDQTLQLMSEQQNLIREFLVDCLRSNQSDVGYLHFAVSDILPIQNLVENLIWTLANDQPNERFINQYTMAVLFL